MDQALKAAYRDCLRLTRRRARNFYYAFLTLPGAKRRAVYAVYAFCREADDIADGEGRIEEKKADLVRLRDRLRQAAAGKPQSLRDLALSDAMARFSIDPADLAHVIDGVERDLTTSRYPSFAELRRYCELVGSAPGLAVLPILAHVRNGAAVSKEDRARATALGIGIQTTSRPSGSSCARSAIT